VVAMQATWSQPVADVVAACSFHRLPLRQLEATALSDRAIAGGTAGVVWIGNLPGNSCPLAITLV